MIFFGAYTDSKSMCIQPFGSGHCYDSGCERGEPVGSEFLICNLAEETVEIHTAERSGPT